MRLSALSDYLGTPHFHAICFVCVGTAAAEGLIAIGAATSRRHWFWRALGVWAAVMALAPVRAYEPALVFAISSPLTAALVRLQRWRSAPDGSPNSPVRFTIRDLALFMLLVGLSLAGGLHLVRHIQRPIITNYALSVAALVAVNVGVAACAFSSRPRRSLCLLLITIGSLAFAIPTLGSPPEVYDALAVLDIGFHPSFLAASVRNLLLEMGELAALLLLVLWLARSGRPASRRALALVAAALITPLAAVYWQMLWLSPLLPPFSTAPNHYDRLMQIAQRVKTLGTLPRVPVVDDERAALLAEAVKLAENANYVPHDPRPNPRRISVDEYTRAVYDFSDLARAMESDAGAAYAQDHKAKALELRLAVIRLGVMLERGAEEPTYLVGRAVEGIALERLIEIRRELSAAETRTVIAALERANAEREAPEISADRDRAIAERAYGWGCHLDNVLERAGFGSDIYPMFLRAARERFDLVRMLEADLAIRTYQHDHRQLPKTLADLVPGYLPRVPRDWHSNQPLCYRAKGSSFTLYSVGQDGVDNGGQFTNARTYYSGISKGEHTDYGLGYDFDLDLHTRP